MKNFWNKLDLAIYLIFIGSFVLKNFLATFMYARILFAINGFLLYVRLLRVYHTSFSLGPKLIIFQKMLPQLYTFLVLLIIFILGYGMASQALITPGAKFKSAFIGNYSLVKGILFAPTHPLSPLTSCGFSHFIPHLSRGEGAQRGSRLSLD